MHKMESASKVQKHPVVFQQFFCTIKQHLGFILEKKERPELSPITIFGQLLNWTAWQCLWPNFSRGWISCYFWKQAVEYKSFPGIGPQCGNTFQTDSKGLQTSLSPLSLRLKTVATAATFQFPCSVCAMCIACWRLGWLHHNLVKFCKRVR